MKSDYPEKWKEIRIKIKARDGNACVICGNHRNLEVHHTREKALPENLITLCKRCHKAYANNYSGLKKKIRIYNDMRLDKTKSNEEVENTHLKLIKDIRAKHFVVRDLIIRLNKQAHKTLDKF